ncbi:sulfotransferase family protein [Candidatus Methylocalor cossyra]|uniref:Sulfotransferase family protein n=1 Tax=Candidatus Methylocalor cossyra TaxID=3108543 RepID=A0ABM9NIG3_9GAMM
MKIVGVGLNKTGTTTLGVCLKYWGLKHLSCHAEAFEAWRRKDLDEVLEWVARHDSFEDWPWPMLYREIDRAFPGTKFILTRRKDAETWFKSLCAHAERTGPTRYREVIYGHAMPHRHRAQCIRIYHSHNQAVRDYFHNRPQDFLEVCWEEGDGWDELAKFLGFPRPSLPFPHANRSPGPWNRWVNRLRRVQGMLSRFSTTEGRSL